MRKPKVLVLLATFNGEKYLQEQLESLYRQKNIEIAIIAHDDGSTDQTCRILKENAKEHKLEWYADSHLGVQNSFFSLMERAQLSDADFFAFCDQDDVWDEDKLSIAVNKLTRKDQDKPLLYYCGQRLVDEKLNFIENHFLNTKRNDTSRFIISDFAGCTGVFNRRLLNEVMKYRPKYCLMHDTWILRVCLCLGGELIIDRLPHISYRQHGNNTVGLGNGLVSKLKRSKEHIFEYRIERLTKELVKGYGRRMTADYLKMSKWICGYRKNKEYKKLLLNNQNVDFCNRGLKLTYRVKVLLKRL